MKFKYSRLFPLSLALAIIPVHFSPAQEVVEAPVEVVEEAPANKQIEDAKMKLEEATRAAESATAEGKEKALEEVETARKRLDDAMERSEAKGEKENRRAEKEASKRAERMEEKAPKEDKAPKGGDKAAEEPEAAPPASEMKPEEAKAGKGEEKAGEPAPVDEPREMAKEDQPEPPKADPKMEPEPSPAPEEKPVEAVTETKEEVKEAKEADMAVDQTTRQVEEKADRRKLNIKDEGEAREMIRDLIGAESEVSKAEAARESRLEPRLRGNNGRQGREGRNRDEIRSASEFLLRQLNGQAKADEAPAFFRRPPQAEPRRVEGRRPAPAVVQAAPPRYYHEGRRYVRFDSRNSIPAILLAAAALERVSVQPANRIDRFFPDDRGGDGYANALPPENYRSDDAVVVSYPVSKSSMISSNDIIFAQGSTRFADGHSYDMVLALADAMANPALKDARFIIEGHASAEGSYENNMALSQRRAEAIVRDMVREGIDPERLIPVGYGESEARYSADSPERLRSLDRNVRVFRTEG